MKQLATLCLCLFAFAKANSQQPTAMHVKMQDTNPPVEVSPTETIKTFFNHFNALEADELEKMMSPEIILHSLTISTTKGRKLTTSTVKQLLDMLRSIPENQKIEERILEFSSTSSKDHATVKTTYEFYVNGKLSHHGTNIFTLFLIDGTWKIVGLADTRLYP